LVAADPISALFRVGSGELSDAALTTDQWQQRVQGARAPVTGVRRECAYADEDPLQSEKDEAEAADQRTLNDPSLQRGDVVAASRGMVVFVGSDGEEHQRGDFLRVPDPAYPAAREH
jgi:hypothetical protein